ncbi:uncharacterized protein LOC110037814 [Phalaenopsis equestris]|uniref:uncharacterized protein LOC110037814 n=1 Tax=Phalaenopsis equestris TaxID=78828 RepID=UPI0009E22DF6|nr:uncharacterized protein LOC110037814 [Phalaenopsis equestris]
MGENLITGALDIDTFDVESVRSRLKELSATLDDALSSSGDSILEPNRLLEDFGRKLLVLSEDHDVEALGPADLEAYIEQLKKDLKSTEEENVKIYGEIDTLQAKVLSDSTNLGGDIDALSTLLDFVDSKGLLSPQGRVQTESPISGHVLGRQRRASEDYEFKVLELSQQIEASRSTLSTLEGLHNVLKRLETICSLEDLFCGVKCIQFEDNCIRLCLRTPILSIDSSRLKKSLGCSSQPTGWDHELLIEVSDKMEIKNIKIVPDDVHLDGIINAVKSSRFLPNNAMENTLGWLVRQIQQRIGLCNLRRLLVKNANKPRRFIVYSDTDETITSHLEGGLVASVKLCQGWPLLSNPLVLWSLKHSDSHSRSFPWSLLCEIQEQANSLDIHTRHELTSFLDAIEILVMEMQAKYANSNASF